MKFLHINHRYAPYFGGSERFVQEISERFVVDGHDVHVLTSDAFDLEYFWDRRRRAIDAPASEMIGGVHVGRVPVRHLPGSSIIFRGGRRLMGEAALSPMPAAPFRWVAAHQPWLPELSAAIDREHSDLIHATNLSLEGLATTAQRAARGAGVPFVLTPFVHLGGSNDRVARRYVSMPHQRELIRRADAVLTMTPSEARFAVETGADAARVHIVGAGVNLEEVSGGDGEAFRHKHRLNGLLVGSIGALAPEKGTIDLVRAVSALRGQGHSVELVLAGAALSSFERWYTALDRREREGIHLLGTIDAGEKRDMLAAIDIFALPSRTESFGIVYLEAWANGKPVIAADTGAVPDLVIDGVNGVLVPFGDDRAIAQSIVELAADGSVRDRLGTNGCQLVHSQHTWNLVFDRVRLAYERVLGTTLRG
jgi:glycogen synthase